MWSSWCASLASHFEGYGWVSDRASFDDRALDARFEMNRDNLRATDDVAFKSLDYAAAGGSWPHACDQLGERAHLHSRGGCDVGSARAGLGARPSGSRKRYTTRALPFAMRNLVCRLIVALLGMRLEPYLQSTTYEARRIRHDLAARRSSFVEARMVRSFGACDCRVRERR